MTTMERTATNILEDMLEEIKNMRKEQNDNFTDVINILGEIKTSVNATNKKVANN